MLLLTLPLSKLFFAVPIQYLRLFFLCLACSLTACHERTKAMSFYYWRQVYSPDSLEKATLHHNAVTTLYVRYFDVDWPPADTAPAPVTLLRFAASPSPYTIIPVVYFRNRVFERLDPAAIPSFAAAILSQVRTINASQQLHNREIQFDCDWTEKTKENYFEFLREYHRISIQSLSSSIRMYQLKYPDRTGIPPVDHGVLLYYNRGGADTGDSRTVFERSVSHRYTPSLRSYPLTLDIALPIFSRPREVKDSQDLMEIVTDINRHSNHHIRNLIFFDLNSKNLLLYDSNVFKEVLDKTD